MLGKLRSSFSHRDKKRACDTSAPPRSNEKLSVGSRLDWIRRKSSGSIAPLSSYRPSNTSLSSDDEASGSFTNFEADALGLHVIHEPDTRPVADIIFVHGLGGHSYKTWSKDHNTDFFWPGLWLPKDPKIGKARLFTYGYDSQLCGAKSVSNIMGFARSLLFDMRYSRGDQEHSLGIGQAPIIFVAHSMGGLVVKKAYLLAQSDKNCRDLAQSISGIVFLSTPHRGTSLAHVLNLILKLLLQHEKSYIKDLESNSPAIEDINEQFRHFAPNLSVISFYEERYTLVAHQPVMIVPRDSAILGCENDEPRGLAANHHTVCKFENDRDEKFRIVRDTLKGLVEKFSQSLFKATGGRTTDVSEAVRKLLAVSSAHVDDLNTLRKRWVAGSCEWVLKGSAMQVWLSNPSDSHLIWYHAPPAHGKSVLSSYVVNHLQSNGYDCQYCFFSYGDQTRRSISEMLKCLAYQISCIMPEYREEILAASAEGFRFDNRNHRWLWRKLFENLLFSKTPDRPLFWVIDGLDESESPKTVVELLQELLLSSRAKMKIFVTSRRTEALALTFKKLERALKISVIDGEEGQKHNAQDIKLLVDRELEDLPGSTAHKERLRLEILQRARGNFLWVSLVLEELQNCQTESATWLALEQIPGDMTKMYERMQLLITDRKDEDRVKLAKELLQWVICAPRPLTLDELQHAISKDYPDILDLKRTIRDVCGQFIVIDSTNHVTTVHQTVRDFLTKASRSSIAIDRQSANSTLLVKSLSGLRSPGLRIAASSARRGLQALEELESKHPFTIYSATSWVYHLGYADPVSDEVLDELEKFLNSPFVLDWIYLLAMLHQVRTLARVGKALLSFVASNRSLNSLRNPMLHRLSTLELLEDWAVDLVRITAKFNKHLIDQPDSIYEIIPAVCPPKSVLHRQFYRHKQSKVMVSGQNDSWNDVFSRFALPQDEVALKIVSSGPYLAVLTQGGTVYVWGSADFGEVCTLHHGESVTGFSMNDKGDLLVTYGLKTTKVWEIPAATVRLQVPNAGNTKAMSLVFAMSDQRILAATDDRSIRFLQITENVPAWEILDESLLKEKTQADSVIINSPNRMIINATGTQVGVCYRSFPLTVWDLNTTLPIGRCMRPTASLDRAATSAQTWFPVELFAWNPVTGHIIGWYKGNTLFKWHPLTDENHEVSASVDELIASPNGKVFVTSDSNGTVKVWNFAYFTVIYQLSSGDLVSGLYFSPDSTRFYDIRGSTITAWEPSGLTRLAESEETFSDTASDEQRGTLISHVSEADAPQYPSLTALSAAPGGMWYVTGNDDGEIYLADTQATFQMELTRFHNFQCVSHLIWGPSGGIVVAADLAADVRIIQIDNTTSGRLKSTDVRHLERPKLTLEGGAIHQMLLNFSSRLLLVISDSLAQIWDIVDSIIKTSTPMACASQQGWLDHPTDHELFLGVGPEHIRIYQWSSLQQIHHFRLSSAVSSLVRQPTSISLLDETVSSVHANALSSARQEPVTKISKVLLTQDSKHMLVYLKEYIPKTSVQKNLLILEVKALDTATDQGKGAVLEYVQIQRHLADKIEVPLGILPGEQLVFFDRDYWLCSVDLTRQSDTDFTRHYFIPRDWTSVDGLAQSLILQEGTLLCIQEGSVVTVRSNFGGIDA
ncbi:uncharacterized protein A1O5_12766 [Cladophialophora psammophila CBS 110553]|uniref:Uncharacterized protein n=1 Tax=Cladophialophora psammophila CBS 110553 TaxID=1182543 RepID=W9VHA0_9EURO|nr:uncharacterized protein A1O5_12766 [Cladophialophora psammophila CBS 110553]EXJ55027.1 hypothetical protein A1O5_12766 [Cladophialophora psammophila CBS 110553]